MNFIVHACALLSFFFLGWMCIRLKKQRQILRQLYLPGHKHAADPIVYLYDLSQALGVSWQGKVKTKGLTTIDLSNLNEFFKKYQIIKFQIDHDTIKIFTNKPSLEWSKKLSQALKVKITVEENY